MTKDIEELPGFQSILDLSDLDPGQQWTSTRKPMMVEMNRLLCVPIRAVLGATSYSDFMDSSLIFLCQQMEAIALRGTSGSPSPYLDSYNRLKSDPVGLSGDVQALISDVEDFTSMAAGDFTKAVASGNAGSRLPNEENYRYALAYFALKGIMASRSTLPVTIPKKKSQRVSHGSSPTGATQRPKTCPPADSWIPPGIKNEVLAASSFLGKSVRKKGSPDKPFDLLNTEFWREFPSKLIIEYELQGKNPPNSKTLANQFGPSSDARARYFTVIHLILMH